MTHDDAMHIDPNDALRNLWNIREGLIGQIRTNDIEYEGVKARLIEEERRFDEALRTSTALTEALQQNTLSIWRIEWKLARLQNASQITDPLDAQDAS